MDTRFALFPQPDPEDHVVPETRKRWRQRWRKLQRQRDRELDSGRTFNSAKPCEPTTRLTGDPRWFEPGFAKVVVDSTYQPIRKPFNLFDTTHRWRLGKQQHGTDAEPYEG